MIAAPEGLDPRRGPTPVWWANGCGDLPRGVGDPLSDAVHQWLDWCRTARAAVLKAPRVAARAEPA